MRRVDNESPDHLVDSIIAGLGISVVAAIVAYIWSRGDSWTEYVVFVVAAVAFVVGTLISGAILAVSTKSPRIAVLLSVIVILAVASGIGIGL